MKRLKKNDFINQLLASAVGPEVDTSQHVVYEVVATSTIPLRGKDGTIFEGAVIKPQTLFQLAASVNREPPPLMVNHDMNDHPKGKFFYGEVTPSDFTEMELRGFLYIDPTETNVINKMDNGTIDETSIAFAAERMPCSKCGWDYAEAVANDDFMPILERTCGNGHKIGEDGTHIELDGVKDTLELSLVSRGAAKNSKIVGQSDSKLGKQIERLAAHGLELSDIYVTASATKGFDGMDTKELIVELSDAKAKASTAEKEVERVQQELAEARGAAAEAETRARDAEARLREAQDALAAAPPEEVREKAERTEKAEATTKAAADFLRKQYVAVLSAQGKTPDNADELEVEDLIKGIHENHPELSAIIPTGEGKTVAANASEGKDEKQDFKVFTTIKHRQR
jgi:hypothetical protein